MTGIQWTDETLNPFRARYTEIGVTEEPVYTGWHCERVSPGCENCYAETFNFKRLGTGLQYTRPNRDRVEHFLDEKMLAKPLHWRKPRRVFISSMTDVFGEWVPDEWLDRLFAVMALTPQHTYQILTKRPERMREYMERGEHIGWSGIDASQRIAGGLSLGYSLEPGKQNPNLQWPLPNVWLGVSVEDQRRADLRVPDLLATPAAVRFLSCEPLLGPLGFRWTPYAHQATGEDYRQYLERRGGVSEYEALRQIDWIICGGESGSGARPMDLAWARGLRDQCQAAEVAFFYKQGGRGHRCPHDAHGGHFECFPDALKVRQFPNG